MYVVQRDNLNETVVGKVNEKRIAVCHLVDDVDHALVLYSASLMEVVIGILQDTEDRVK